MYAYPLCPRMSGASTWDASGWHVACHDCLELFLQVRVPRFQSCFAKVHDSLMQRQDLDFALLACQLMYAHARTPSGWDIATAKVLRVEMRPGFLFSLDRPPTHFSFTSSLPHPPIIHHLSTLPLCIHTQHTQHIQHTTHTQHTQHTHITHTTHATCITPTTHTA